MEKTIEKAEIMDENEAELATSRIYEVGFNIIPSVSLDDVPREFGNIKGIIEKHSGVFISEALPKLTPLAYSMFKMVGTKKEKYNEAYFGWIKFEAGSDEVKEIKKELESYENILRFMILKTVRESTLAQGRVMTRKGDGEKKVEGSPEEGTVPASPEAIDASIEKLVIE